MSYSRVFSCGIPQRSIERMLQIKQKIMMERETGLEPATSALARRRSTK